MTRLIYKNIYRFEACRLTRTLEWGKTLAKLALDIALLSVGLYALGSGVAGLWPKGAVLAPVFSAVGSLGLLAGGLAGLASLPQALSWPGVFAVTAIAWRMTPLAAFFIVIIGLVGLFVSVYGAGYMTQYSGRQSAPLLSAGVLLFLAAMAAVVLAGNVFTFLASWESMSIVSYLLVSFEHERPEIQKAGLVYVVMTHLGTVFLTLAFLLVAGYAGSYSFAAMHAVLMPIWAKTLVFVFALLGFGTKAGLVPLHVWLPRAHPVAPSHVSALMSGVMLKTALYGFILVVFQFLGGGQGLWGAVLVAVGAVSALLGVIHALAQRDFKRMLAYSSIENMGLIFMGLGMTLIFESRHAGALASLALLATLAHTINHAVFKSLLFLGAGAVLSRTHTADMDLLGGLIRTMPWTAAFTLVGSLAIAAMPPFNGFVGEWLLFQSAFALGASALSPAMQLAAVGAVGALAMTGALVAMAFVRSFGTMFLALPRSDQARRATDEVPLSMRLGMGGLAALCVAMGIFPAGWTGWLQSPIAAVLGRPMAVVPPRLALAGISGGDAHWVPLLVLGPALAAALGAAIVRRRTSRGETWACGGTLTPAMTYTASGYSKPVRIAFQRIVRPSRMLQQTAGDLYFPVRYVYVSGVGAFAEAYLYRPAVALVLRAALFVRRIQNGQVQSYLAYLFLTLLVVLLWVR